MRIYLIRHADPDYAVDGITNEGELEAAALAERMAAAELTHLYVSPLGRARATMAPIEAATGMQAEVLPWTTEWGHLRLDTQHGKRCIWDLDGEDLRSGVLAENPLGWRSIPPLNNAELHTSYDEMVAGSDALTAKHGYRRVDARYAVAAPNQDRIAVVCHGGFGLSWLAHLLGIPLPIMWSSYWLAPTSVSLVLLDQRSDEWAVPRALCIGETSHLYADGRRPLPRGIKANYY
ncbi:MAG: histidine phosphatase family protein [Planctomycetota bacterium]|jgi:broad specificity phosphatase PhoE|nr:histidine phosphatase family protein [Planctomycetota bacterium]